MRTLVADDDETLDESDPSPADDAAERPARRRLPEVPAQFTTLVVGALVALGVAARFVSPSKLWLDEALSVNIATLPVGDLLEALKHDGHPPLYYLLLHYWMAAFGEGDMVVRALSGIFGVAALPLAWIAGRRLAGAAGARWALLVVALSPYCVRYSTETRMYSLVMLLVLAGYLLLTDALKTPTPLRLAGIAVVSGLLLLSHYWSIWLLGATGLLLVARWWRQADERPTTLKAIVAIAAGGVLFLPWVPSFLYQSSHTGTPWGEPFRPTAVLQLTMADMSGGNNFSEGTLGGYFILVFLLAALFVVRTGRREMVLDVATAPLVRRELAVSFLTIAIGCGVGYATSATFQSRYAAVFIPLVLVAAAVGITRVPEGVARTAAGGAFLTFALIGVGWINYFERTQSPQIAAVVADHAQPGDVVVYCPDQLGPDYSREMPDGLVELSYPTLDRPERIDWVDYAERNAAADPLAIAADVRQQAAGHSIFVVWKAEYLTYGQQCEQFLHAVGQGRTSQNMVTQDGGKYYEPANLTWMALPAS
jgi:mannosyltransferase